MCVEVPGREQKAKSARRGERVVGMGKLLSTANMFMLVKYLLTD